MASRRATSSGNDAAMSVCSSGSWCKRHHQTTGQDDTHLLNDAHDPARPHPAARTCVMLKRHGEAAEHCLTFVVLPCSGGVKCPAEVVPYQSAHGSSLTMSLRSPSRTAPTAEPEYRSCWWTMRERGDEDALPVTM